MFAKRIICNLSAYSFHSFRENDFTYVTLLNIFDGFETVNLNQSLSDLTAQMEVVLVSGNSKRKVE